MAHALEVGKLVARQAVEVGNVADHSLVDELIDQRLPQAVDIHGAPPGEVQQRLLELGRTRRVDAAVGDLAFGAKNFAAAHRAFLGDAEFAPVGRTLHHFDHLRDHLAGALDEHRVADLDAQALDLVHVVERCVAHRDPAHVHRFEVRHGSERAGAADLDADVLHHGRGLARRILEGDGPARRLCRSAELVPQARVIHFDDDAVDLVVERVALRFPFLDEPEHLVERPAEPPVRVDLEAGFRQPFEDLPVLGQGSPAVHQDLVEVHIEPALGHELGVKKAHRAGGRVARVGEFRLAGGLALRVQLLEGGA